MSLADLGNLPADDALTIVRAKCRQVGEETLAAERRVQFSLFGSRAAKRACSRSDIDIGIDLGHPLDAETMVRLGEEFDGLPILQKVDLVDFSRVTPEFLRNARRHFEVFYERGVG